MTSTQDRSGPALDRAPGDRGRHGGGSRRPRAAGSPTRSTAFLDRQDARLVAVGNETGELVRAVRELLGGGKRLRPAFGYWGWRGAGMPDDERIVTAAAALELFQACALIHDDVMDGSDTRRGQPAAHRRFGRLHGSAGWRGDGDSFGTGAAILLGDLCLAWSDEMFFGSGLEPARLDRARPLFDEMRTELMGGQYLDLLEQAMGGGSVVARPAGHPVQERPLHRAAPAAARRGAGRSGAAAAGRRTRRTGCRWARRSSCATTCSACSATRPRPASRPATTCARASGPCSSRWPASPAARPRPGCWSGTSATRGWTGPAWPALREIIVATGALAEVERMIRSCTEQAVAALAASPVDPCAEVALHELATAATVRTL